jgi:hypothetical protein
MDEPVFPEAERRASARTLAGALGLLTLLALGAIFDLLRGGAGALLAMTVETLAFAACAASAWLEWRRARQAEIVALFAVLVSIAAGIGLLPTGQYWYWSLAQGVAGVVAALMLARRFIVRDEGRHRHLAH